MADPPASENNPPRIFAAGSPLEGVLPPSPATATTVSTTKMTPLSGSHLPMPLLSVEVRPGKEALVPFVHPIVLSVDRQAGRIVLDPPEGLLDL